MQSKLCQNLIAELSLRTMWHTTCCTWWVFMSWRHTLKLHVLHCNRLPYSISALLSLLLLLWLKVVVEMEKRVQAGGCKKAGFHFTQVITQESWLSLYASDHNCKAFIIHLSAKINTLSVKHWQKHKGLTLKRNVNFLNVTKCLFLCCYNVLVLLLAKHRNYSMTWNLPLSCQFSLRYPVTFSSTLPGLSLWNDNLFLPLKNEFVQPV